MRTLTKFALVLPTLVVSIPVLQGCQASCEDKGNCGPYVPDDVGGSGGKGGTTGGKGGNGGSGGGTSGGDGGEGQGGEGASGTSGSAGEAGSGGGGCDTNASPSTETCLISDEHAVFVSPTGNDGDAGTMAAPYATLSKAVLEAAEEKVIIVCNSSFDEEVLVEVAARVYGGFDCENWQSTEGAPLFQPSTDGPALKIDGVEAAVEIEGVDFAVGDAVGAGASAVTAIVNASASVTLRRVTLTAGAGDDGASGDLTDFEYPAQSELNGNPENPVTMGGAGKTCNCQNAFSSIGGVGGTPIAGGQDGSDGLPDHGGGEGGNPDANDCSKGSGGANGTSASAAPPAAGATTYGNPSPTGWQPTAGSDGETGEPGQGGGGGASLNEFGHGGGGGCGGCGGNGGTGGKGGGGSITLLLVDSLVTLESCVLVAGDAGDGGTGAAGQPGQQDQGAGGGVVSSLNSCPGGNGGKGGNGGAGGGGAGGISAGIVWTGEIAPTVSDDTMITVGNAGAPGEGGAGTNDGIAGVQQEVLPLN